MNRTSAIEVALLTCLTMLASGTANAAPRGDPQEVKPLTAEERELSREQLAQEMAAWLPRLVGRFDFDGLVEFPMDPDAAGGNSTGGSIAPPGNSDGGSDGGGRNMESGPPPPPPNLKPISGKGDCIAIGAGPGVQCVVHAFWEQEWTTMGRPVEGGVSFLGPAAILYGLEPNAAGIRYLMLNTNGIAESETGSLSGYTLRWVYETRCETDTSNRCRQVTRLRAVPDSRLIQATIEIEEWTPEGWALVTSINFDMRRVKPVE